MSSLAGSSQHNLKKVLRTALVGIKPADQVILKGYLRVLLRLEADLDWVSANHTDVDLFMINNEFREAQSVKNLLAKQVHKPVLFVSRSETGEGKITDEQLVLPLKKLNELSDWLARHVTALSDDIKAISETSDASEQSQTAQNLQSATQHSGTTHTTDPQEKKATELLSSTSTNATSDKHSVNTATPDITQDYESIIEIIKQLHQQPQGLFELSVEGHKAAIIEPTSGRIWPSQSSAGIEKLLDWRLSPYQGQTPEAEQAINLSQWLWDIAWANADTLVQLISINQSYQLRYWIKPDNNSDRRVLLRIMTVLEMSPRTVAQLARNAQTSRDVAKKAIAALLLSGNLQAESYETITVNSDNVGGQSGSALPVTDNDDSAAANNEAESAAAAAAELDHAKLSPLERVLARRKAGIAAPAYGSDSSNQATNATPKQEPAKSEIRQTKMGFLAKLRQKLGL